MSHHINVCEWGFVHSRCRCRGDHNEVRATKCNSEISHKHKYGSYAQHPSVKRFIVQRVKELLAEAESLFSRG